MAPAVAGVGAVSWSPDRRFVAVAVSGERTRRDLALLDMTTGTSRTLAASPFDETSPAIAPNGLWLAYVSNETGQQEVYLRSYPAGARTVRVSRDGGAEPVWARDGSELYFRVGSTMMAVPVTGEGSGRPVPLFTLSGWLQGGPDPNYDVSPDGRFVVTRWLEPDAVRTHVHVVLGWAETLRNLVPRP